MVGGRQPLLPEILSQPATLKRNRRFFFKAFKSFYGKVGRSASEEVIFQLIKSKCLPVLMYGLDVCPTNSADRHSLQQGRIKTLGGECQRVMGALPFLSGPPYSPPLSPFPSLPSPPLPHLSPPLPSPPLEVGPLNTARGSGGAL